MERSIPHIRSIFSSRKKVAADDHCLCDRNSRSNKEAFEVGGGAKRPGGGGGAKEGGGRSYSSKTLTERDVRHLERHLSMKKTIRKQISRNLAQAFLDNPDLFEPDAPPPDRQRDAGDQNVLRLLKVSVEERDSGHSSPTHHDDTDTDTDDDKSGWSTHGGRREPSTAVDSCRKQPEGRGGKPEQDRLRLQQQELTGSPEKKSLWKMFTSRNKTKR